MKTPYLVRSLFAIASIISLSWPMSVMAQSTDGMDSAEQVVTEPSVDESAVTENDWLYRAEWDDNSRDIVYSAGMKKQKTDMAPTSVYVITDDDIANHGWRTLAEMLRHVPGVQTVTHESQFQSVAIRSMGGADQFNTGIVWMQDGVPLNDVHTSGFYLDETYPVELIRRIEVVTGPGAAMYGHGATQGVIHIFTKSAKDIDKYGEYRLTLQNNLTFKGSATAAYYHEDKDLGIVGHVSGNTTQGAGLVGNHVYNMYVMNQAGDNVESKQTPTFYRAETMDLNSDKHWTDVSFKLNYKSFKWNLGFQYIHSGLEGSEPHPFMKVNVVDIDQAQNQEDDIEKTNPVESLTNPENCELGDSSGGLYNGICGNLNMLGQKYARTQFYTDLIYADKLKDDFELQSVISYRLNHFDYFVTDDQRIPDTDEIPWINESFYTHQVYANAQLLWRIADSNFFTAGVSVNYQGILTEDNADSLDVTNDETSDDSASNDPESSNDAHFITPSVYIMDEQRLWNDRISLTAGLRFDAYHLNGDYQSYLPSAHAGFFGAFTDWMSMRLSYGFAPKSVAYYLYKYNNHINDVTKQKIKNSKFVDTGYYLEHHFDSTQEELHHKAELALLFKPAERMNLDFSIYYHHIDNPILLHLVDNQAVFNSYNNIVKEKEQIKQILMYNQYGVSNYYLPVSLDGASTDIVGLDIAFNTAIGEHWNLYAHYSFLYSHYIYPTDLSYSSKEEYNEINTEKNIYEKEKNIYDDKMHTAKLGTTYMNDYLTADLAFFFVGGTAPRKSLESWREDNYNNPFYAVFQPQISVKLPANLGLMVQGSYAFSEGMTESPTYRYYYEKEGVPVNRYSVMFSLLYPFRK